MKNKNNKNIENKWQCRIELLRLILCYLEGHKWQARIIIASLSLFFITGLLILINNNF